MMSSLPKVLSFAVAPMDSPTVPNAEITSKRYSTKEDLVSALGGATSWVSNRKKKIARIRLIERSNRETLLETVSWGMLFLNTLTCELLWSRAHVNITRTARVVVLTPPPHDPGEAPRT